MEMFILENRATGKQVKQPVSAADFDEMERKGRGLKLFKIINRVQSAPLVNPPAEKVKKVEVPPEVTVIKAKKKQGAGAGPSDRTA